MKNEVGFHVPVRPMPPEWLFEMDTPNFVPAPELWEWIRKVFLDPKSKLFNPDHMHLRSFRYPDIAVMWARSGFKKQGRQVIGTTEKVMINAGGWRKARQEQQMRDWFGFVPTYLITVDASFCERANDTEFCYLLEHELYHIGVMRDEDGEIVYSDSSGLPKHYLAGHDVEEFIGVVKRYGPSKNVKRLIEVAKNPPFVSNLDISKCCGNCVIN
ncbi:putative metallopeptidase [Acinetobacter baumannii]|nr:transposase [Acinetobacter baumannii]MCE6428349.1 transposase [Acinetobacter baumannii]HCQ5377345.1 transposase [Acinetobacter baumannii]HCW4673396.1 transposase [Acinetobacter baumannii]HEE5923328.1 transposase [Acinetobacter baumannii]